VNSETTRRISVLLAVGLAVAVVYVGWVFLDRHRRAREHEEAVRKKERESYSSYSNQDLDALRILHFYASPSRVKAGQAAILCYGVQGAKSVHISNVDEALKPTRNRCLTIKPAASMTYTLVVEGKETASQETATFVLKVDPPG